MRPEAAAQQLERGILAQRRGVLSDALGLMRRMGREELLAAVSEVLAGLGLERVAPISDLAGAPACAAELPIGASRLTTLVSIRIGSGVVNEDTLEAFRTSIEGRAALGVVLSAARVRREIVERGEMGTPPIALFDADSLGIALERAGVLVQSAGFLPPLLLQVPKRASASASRRRPSADGRGRAPRLFRWVVEDGPGRAFTLVGEYLPDPSLSFRVPGELVPVTEDFLPARTTLHQAICTELRGIFPDLPPSMIRTKAWPGVHKVYRVDLYGRPQGEK